MFERLARLDVPWDRVTLFQVDERVAPDGDPSRNLTHLLRGPRRRHGARRGHGGERRRTSTPRPRRTPPGCRRALRRRAPRARTRRPHRLARAGRPGARRHRPPRGAHPALPGAPPHDAHLPRPRRVPTCSCGWWRARRSATPSRRCSTATPRSPRAASRRRRRSCWPTPPRLDGRGSRPGRPREAARRRRRGALVEDGMRVGLGTGSTVAYFLSALGREQAATSRCVATSPATASSAAATLGLRVEAFDDPRRRSTSPIDGADQVAPDGWLVKGAGGAHTREKVVAASATALRASSSTAPSSSSGSRAPVPLELWPSASPRRCARLGAVSLRDAPRTPDGGVLADYRGEVGDPAALADAPRCGPRGRRARPLRAGRWSLRCSSVAATRRRP